LNVRIGDSKILLVCIYSTSKGGLDKK
jgi:hypothetical protein